MNTSNTFLYYKASGAGTSFAKLSDITSFPDVFTPPERIDASDLSSNQKKYEPGMVDLPNYVFGANYTKNAYDTIKGLEGTQLDYQLRFGAAGADGAWQWTGDIFVTPKGAGVGALRTMEITCYPSGAVTVPTISG